MNRIFVMPTIFRRRGLGRHTACAAYFCGRHVASAAYVLLPICAVLAGWASRVPLSCAAENGNATAVAAAKAESPRETWDIYFLQGHRVGYGCTTIRHETEDGKPVVRTENTSRLSIQREGQTSQQDLRSLSVETPEGRVLRFESEMQMGTSPLRVVGTPQDNRLRLEIGMPGAAAPREKFIEWPAGCRGPFAVEQSLARQPMQPGERRTLKIVMPEFNQVADVELSAQAYEATRLLHGMHNLLRIETVARLPLDEAGGRMKIEQTVWADRTGEALRTYMPTFGGMESFRASKAEALEKIDAAEFDLMSSMMVKVARPLVHPRETKQVRYRVRLDKGDPARVFVTGPTQSLRSIDPHTAEITVYAIRPGESDGNRNAPAERPTADDLRPNSLIESDNALIVADAAKAAGDEKDPWRVAVALEAFVNREVTTKDFTQAFATAAEVARTREGDCTEHAVFLAGLARARGIPARVAMGLVYLASKQAFFYHMWTEVYVGKRWIPIDGTLADGGIGADHLKIAQSNLNGASAYVAFVPVAQVAGRLKIEILEAK
jgi:hypothetical protein